MLLKAMVGDSQFSQWYFLSNHLVQIIWSKAEFQIELSLAQFSPNLFGVFNYSWEIFEGADILSKPNLNYNLT